MCVCVCVVLCCVCVLLLLCVYVCARALCVCVCACARLSARAIDVLYMRKSYLFEVSPHCILKLGMSWYEAIHL